MALFLKIAADSYLRRRLWRDLCSAQERDRLQLIQYPSDRAPGNGWRRRTELDERNANMPGVSTQDLATWQHGSAVDLEAPPSPLPRPTRSGGDVRIARVDSRQRTEASAAGAAAGMLGQGALGAKIILRIRGRVIVVDEGEIDWIDGAGNYVRIHVGPARHQVRATLKDVEQLLAGAGERFVRVHRSTVVNLHSVREFLRTPYGDLIAVLRGGQRLAVGRVYRGKIEALLETKL
jgi:hypothetical protein